MEGLSCKFLKATNTHYGHQPTHCTHNIILLRKAGNTIRVLSGVHPEFCRLPGAVLSPSHPFYWMFVLDSYLPA